MEEKVKNFLVLALAFLGFVNFASGVLQNLLNIGRQGLGFIGSVVLLSVSAGGVVWLVNGLRMGSKKDILLATLLIVGGIFLYKFVPDAFPKTFSLAMP